MKDFEVRGADDFLKLSKVLKAAARTDLRRELHKGLRKAVKPLVPQIREAFREGLPHRGGAGEFIAGKRIRPVVKTGRDPGVSIVVNKQDPRLETEGRLAHPVFNRRRADGKRVYVVQQVTPHLLEHKVKSKVPEIRHDLEQAIRRVVDKVVRDG